MIEDPKVAWPAKLKVMDDGIGNDPEYLRHIMEESMESLIHHFKMVTEGVSVPAGEVYVPVESPRGELGMYVVSDGGHRPYRVKIRDPSFVNLQSVPAMVQGGMVADAVAVISSLDPVMGGVDR
jgi:NADH-quinone oxidoreductase subunit D